ncbi:MAG: hypothetical protein HY314_10565 [Acidobacteria bacterium]|nr:hypothetical protein [Acidobacteriota bacterium]
MTATSSFSLSPFKADLSTIPFRVVAGDWHPDHDTIANFGKTFAAQIKELFVQVLLLAGEAGVLKLGNISVDGSKSHADGSKSHAVSYNMMVTHIVIAMAATEIDVLP